MSLVNDQLFIERIISPDELTRLRQQYPTLLEALRVQQVLLNQVIIRSGGTGPGTDVINLDELTSQVETLENQQNEEMLSSIAARVAALENALDRDTPIDKYAGIISRIESLEAQL